MADKDGNNKRRPLYKNLYSVPLFLGALLLVCAVIAQPDVTLFTGLWEIQISEAGLITDPVAVGGVGAALLNAALVLLMSTFLLRRMRIPCTGITLACLFLMGGFALLGKNLLNTVPIIFGGWLYSRYEDDSFSRVIYLTLFGTCLSPLVSFVFTRLPLFWRIPAMIVCGAVIGFLIPPISVYTSRVHQGYDLYNVGFAAGILGLGAVSVLKGFGVEFATESTWSTEGHMTLCIFMVLLLLGLLVLGLLNGCHNVAEYRHLLRHSGRSVADFIVLDGAGVTLVNMALVGAVALLYMLALYPFGVRLNGPIVCCILTVVGFGAFGKHLRNIIPVMTGAALAAIVMPEVSLVAPGTLLASLLCTGLAPISGQFGWYWGLVAGAVHMAVVQYTSVLHGGMDLYNNGFAAGLVCICLIPIIEALKPEPKE